MLTRACSYVSVACRDSTGDAWHSGSVAKKPITEGAAQGASQTSQTTGTNAPQEQPPDSANPASAGPAVQTSSSSNGDERPVGEQEEEDGTLVFHFAPDMKPLILPEAETLLEGTDSYVFF